MSYTYSVLTASDRRALDGLEDLGGQKVMAVMARHGYTRLSYHVVEDDKAKIEAHLRAMVDEGANVIITTGGTGFAKRDVTPEATRAVIDKEAPGLAELMRYESYKITPHAMLSRQVCGIAKDSIIINLPGSVKAIEENLDVVLPLLSHGIDLILGAPEDHTFHGDHTTRTTEDKVST
ncbi:MogA/MoaB family molybdenum cofactor biosynthesis protein [Peptoniphilus equinus]|uniref:MogA/MoaB family molybdenum cofactor biosynthesis protein n=1 Tax=Peptoniphilus equinus TaxID=3016343 RepID=A0ABY7QVX5_9FIRM|nr:MogA/MoaB family molybdenum cofactor biosynthesis protein [Peptoniphilus equinus]WBW50068.1 MogA/MoaB family molybdenum cofactor biosynthesis protein [Peptoniphilus equinus]